MATTGAVPLIALAGPTAVGKTAVGIRVARELGGEIVSVDSRQVYRGMDIGTAKPGPQELSLVRHHLVDVKEPAERYSAGQFGRDARRVIRELDDSDTAAVLVGGSGLYLEAALDGFSADDDGDGLLRTALKERMEQEGLASLYEELGRIDPLAQARLAPGDTRRVLRALELAHHGPAGRRSPRQQTDRGPLPCLPLVFCLCMERSRLYRRIDRRVETMLASGLVEEVSRLAAAGYDRDTPAMGTMGYREILEYLAGDCSLETAADRIRGRTRNYAKRQVTWFRRDRRVRWLDVGRLGEEGATQRILAQARSRVP